MSSVFENLGANLVLDDDMETFCHSELESDPFILVGTALFHTITFKCSNSIVPMTNKNSSIGPSISLQVFPNLNLD